MSNKLSLVVNFLGIDKMSAALRNITGTSKAGSKSIRELNGDARKLKREMTEAGREIAREFARANGNVAQSIARYRELENRIAAVNRQLERQKRVAAIDAGVRQAGRGGAEMKDRGVSNATTGGFQLVAIGAALKAAIDYDGVMADIGIKLGINERETKKLSGSILLAATNSKQLPSVMQAAADTLASAGTKAADIPNMLGAIGKVATAYNALPNDLAGAAAAGIQNLGLTSSETAKQLAYMAVAGKDGKYEIKDFGAQFSMLAASAGVLKQKGLSAVADLSAAAQIVAQGVGGDMSVAGNNLNNLLLKINSKETIGNFEKLGVDLPKALQKAYQEGKTPAEAIAELTNKALGGNLEKLSLLFGDQQAQAALQQLVPKLAQYRALRASIQNRSGEVAQDFERKAGTAQAGVGALLGNLQVLAITVGQTVLPDLVTFSGFLVSAAQNVSAFAQAHPTLTRYMIMAAAGSATLRVGIGALQFAFGGVVGPAFKFIGAIHKIRVLGSVAAAFPKIGTALSTVRAGFNTVAATGPLLRTAGSTALTASKNFAVAGARYTAMTARFVAGKAAAASGALLTLGRAAITMGWGFLRAGIMMLANPIVLIIAGIALGVGLAAYAIYNHWDTIKAAFNTGITWVQGILNGAATWFSNIGKMMMQGLILALNPALLVQKLLSIARAGITAFKGFFGIKSPSRLFMQMGGHMTSGLAIGIDRGAGAPQRAVGTMMRGIAASGSATLSPGGPDLARRLNAAPAMRPAASAMGRGAGAPAPITVQIYGAPGQDVEALADAVMRKLKRVQGVQARSSYEGDR